MSNNDYHDMIGPGGYGPRDCPWSGNRGDYGAGALMMGMGHGMMNPDDEVDPAEKPAGTGEEN